MTAPQVNDIDADAATWHGTTSPGVEDVVHLDQAYSEIEIANRGMADLWVTVDRGPHNEFVTHPGVDVAGCYYIGAGGVRTIRADTVVYVAGQSVPIAPSVARVMSPQAVEYSVTGGP